VVWRESRIGLLLGLAYGLVLAIYCMARFEQPLFGVGVGIAITAAMATAAIAGSIIPLTLERLGVDPAVATMPFVTTLMDLVGGVIYFSVTTALIAITL
jgi:magnesium transporter